MADPETYIEDAIQQAMNEKYKSTPHQGDLHANAVRVSGYRGKSEFDNWTRLYLNEQLSEYIEVSTRDILVTLNLAGNESPFILLVIDGDADIRHVVASTEQVKAEFLGGAIAQRHLRGNRPGGIPFGSKGAPVAATANCGSFGIACGSFGIACGSFGIACGSFGIACGSWGYAC